MCRNIKTLYNFDPPATNEEILLASEQFVRKLTGLNKPSEANKASFDLAIEEISHSASHLLANLNTSANPKNREVEKKKAHERSLKRFGNN